MNNNENGGKFLNGFLWGAILGGGIIFLLGTKKGKKLLKTITEEGLEGISQIEDLVEDEVEEYDEEPPVIVKSKSKESVKTVKTDDEVNNAVVNEESPVAKIASSTQSVAKDFGGQAKRLFKGIHKKS